MNTDKVIELVLPFFEGITREMLESKSRDGKIIEARHMCIKLARGYTVDSSKTIGSIFGGRHHTTVLSAVRMIQNRIDTSRKYRELYESIEAHVRANINEHGFETPPKRAKESDAVEFIEWVLKEDYNRQFDGGNHWFEKSNKDYTIKELYNKFLQR